MRGGLLGSGLGIGVLALLLVLRSSAPTPQGPSAPLPREATAQSQIPANASAPQQVGPWKASQEHFAGIADCGAEKPSSPAPQPKTANRKARGLAELQGLRRTRWCIPDSMSALAVIAVVSDPGRSQLPLFFDHSVEAIELASESVNYVHDRYWFPWQLDVKEQFSDYASQTSAVRERRERLKQPGVMLFRWNGDRHENKPGLLYVFLVGDSPAAGMNGLQFTEAVDYVKEICSLNPNGAGCGPDAPLRVMGPTFSGSLDSLVHLTGADDTDKFIAYSGTVSSECAQENLYLRSHSDSSPCPAQSGTDGGPKNLAFRTLVNSSEFSVQRLLAFLKGKHHIRCDGGPPEVAILSEAGTAYGSAEKSTIATRDASAEKTSDSSLAKYDCPYVSFSYPREISSLRNAYQLNSQAPQPDTNGNSARPFLPLNLSEQAGQQGDEPPDFSHSQGPLSKEAVLMKYAAELRRAHYRFIGISGSNVLDVLFLADFLRRSYPDSRLFIILGSDLMFERELDNASYIGTLTVSTYPLIADNLDWTEGQKDWQGPRRRARLPFPDQFEEGEYNALLLTFREVLHQDDPQPYEMNLPFSSSDKASADSTEHLPLWVAAVGSGGFWPVEILDPLHSPSINKSLAYLPSSAFTQAWQGMVVLLFMVAVVHILVLLTASPVAPHFRGFALIRAVSAQRLFFIHSAGSSLALALFMIIIPWISYAGSGQGLIALFVLLALIAIAGLPLTSGLVTLNFWLRWRQDGKEKTERLSPTQFCWRMSSFLVVWIAACIGGFYWFRLFEKSSDNSLYGLFFAFRTVHLTTGVSPLVPMLMALAGIYIWSVFEAWRLSFNEHLRPRLDPGISENSHLPGTGAEKQVACSISFFFLQWKYVIIFCVVFAIWLLLFQPLHAFELFERPPFEYIYEVMLFVLVAIMLSRGLRFGQIWSELRKLLLALEFSRMRVAFTRLKSPGWSPIWKQGTAEAEFTNIKHSLETLQQIINCNPDISSDVQGKIETAKCLHQTTDNIGAELRKEQSLFPTVRTTQEYSRSGGALTSCFDQLETSFQALQTQLAVVLHSLWEMLEKHWNEDCLSLEESRDFTEDGREDHPDPCPDTENVWRIEEYVAQRYIAFIRGALIHMKHSLIFLGISFSLILVSLNIYSFEPHRTLVWSLTIIFFVVGFTVVRALMQMHRNHILSLITGTKPNELGTEFYLRVVGYGAVPLVTLIATHFPSIGHYLVSLVQPGLDALK